MTNEVRVRVVAQDAASKEFNAIAANAGKMGAAIKASIAGAALAGFATLGAAIKGSISEAQESIRVNGQLSAVLTSTGGAAGVSAKMAQDLATHFQHLTKYQDEAVLSAENLLLTFTNIKSDIFPDTTKAVLDLATGIKGGAKASLEELQTAAIQVGKAMNNPIAGVTALRRVGVQFTDQQEEQIKTLTRSGHVLEAQKMILVELQKEFGGSASHMEPFERVMKTISDTVHDGQEAIGKLIIGGLVLLSQWVQQHGPQIQSVLSAIAPVFKLLRDQAETQLGGIIGLFKSVANTVIDLVGVFEDLIHGRWQKAWQGLGEVVKDVAAGLVNEVAAIAGAIPNLLIRAINEAIQAVSSKQILPSLNLGPLGHTPEVKTPDLSSFKIPELPVNIFDVDKGLDALNKAAQGAKPPVVNLGGAMDDFGEKGKTLAETLRDGVSGIRGAAAALFSAPTKEMASLDLSIAELTQTNRKQRPAIEAAIESYNKDADAHESAASAIEASASRMSAAMDQVIGQMEDGLADLRDKFDQESQLRDKQLKNQSRADQDAQNASSDRAESLRRQKSSLLDSLNDQKDAIPDDAPDVKAQKDALDKQIKALSDSYDKQIQGAEDAAKSQSRANEQRDRDQEDAMDRARKIEDQKEKDAEAAIAWQKKQKEQMEADAKKAAEDERALAGKAKDEAEAAKRRLEQFDKEEASLKLRLDLMNGEHEIMKKRIVTLDQTLLSEAQLRDKAGELGLKVFTLTGAIQTVADKMNIDLTGAFDGLKAAVEGMAATMSGASMPHYANGTNFVPEDGPAYLHRGEKVITASNNQSVQIFGNVYMGAPGSGGGTIDDLMLASLN